MFKHFCKYLYNKGFKETLSVSLFELWFGILYEFNSLRLIRMHTLLADPRLSKAHKKKLRLTGEEYQPTAHLNISRAFQMLPCGIKVKCILDLGAGNGRLMYRALAAGAKKVYGIEISPLLAHQGEKQLTTLQKRFGWRGTFHYLIGSTDLVTFPEDVDIVYMFNPFHGEVLQSVIAKLHTMGALNPFILLYVNGCKDLSSEFQLLNTSPSGNISMYQVDS